MKKTIKNLLSFTLSGTLIYQFARAYLDPGSGSLIIQFLVAALLGGMVLIKDVRNWIFGLFKRKDNGEGIKEGHTKDQHEE